MSVVLVLGGARSGKSRFAEGLVHQPAHYIATAQAFDDEMRERIERHQLDRAERVQGMTTIEEPTALSEAIQTHTDPQTLLVVDCLTLWLTNLMMPHEALKNTSNESLAQQIRAKIASLLIAIKSASGPVVLVGNEIGLGVIPMGRETRQFVDALGRLNQDVAATCQRVTFMAAGLPLTLKG